MLLPLLKRIISVVIRLVGAELRSVVEIFRELHNLVACFHVYYMYSIISG